MFSPVIILTSESTQSQIHTLSLNLAWICPLKGIFHSLSTRHEHSNTTEMKSLLYRPVIHEPTHISISSFQSSHLLWLFIWWETNHGYTIVRNKNHFHIEGYRKAKYGEKKYLCIGTLCMFYNVTPEETKRVSSELHFLGTITAILWFLQSIAFAIKSQRSTTNRLRWGEEILLDWKTVRDVENLLAVMT